MTMRSPWRGIHLGLAALVLLPFACSSDGKAPRTASRKGIVKTINIPGREVTMTYQNKRGEQKDLAGTFNDETRVEINGRLMTMNDIRVGDKVEVFGRKEGEGTAATFIATRVSVTRNDNDWQDTGKAAADKPETTETAKAGDEG